MNHPEQRRQQGHPHHGGNQPRPQGGQQREPIHGSPASHTQQKTTETTKEESTFMKIKRSVKQAVQGFTPVQMIAGLVAVLLLGALIVTMWRNTGVTRDVVKMDRPADVVERIPMTFSFPVTNVPVFLPDSAVTRVSGGYLIHFRNTKMVNYIDFVSTPPTVKAE